MDNNEPVKDALFENEVSDHSIFSAILLITGTCIGAGILALPFVTGLAGFYPSLLISALCWLSMLATGLLFLEATLWLPDGANLLTIADKLLGKTGKYIGGIFFIFLYYCLMVSYLDEGSSIFANMLLRLTGVSVPANSEIAIFSLVIGLFVLWGTKLVSRVNWLLITALFLSYCLLIGAGSTVVKTENLKHADWNFWLVAAPTLFSAYGYHNIIPTLTTYMKRDSKKMRIAIIVGASIPFIVYLLWQWMMIGALPLDVIQQTVTQKGRIYHVLQEATGNSWIGKAGAFFAFFALVTSLLGVSLSMVDFFGDGFGVKRSSWTRLWLCLLVFTPAGLFAFANPGIFLEAIAAAGGFGEAVLNSLIPIALVWVGRYRLCLGGDRQLGGGRPLLVILLLFTILIIAMEVIHLWA